MQKRAGLFLACIVSGTIACQDLGPNEDTQANGPVGVALEPIIGGVPATGYPEAALLDMGAANGAVYACSATLIAPKVVLTAGHCVDAMTSFNVYVGTTKRPGGSAEVYDWHENGATTVNPNHHDIGLVYLQDAITLPSYPKLATSAVANGSRVLNVGRILNNQLTSSLYQASTNVTGAAAVGYPYDYYSPDIIEHGDSGGPVFADGTHTIVAVNSGAGGGTQVLARVDLLYSWIQDRIATHGGAGPDTNTGGASSKTSAVGASATGGKAGTGGSPSTAGMPSTGDSKATGGSAATGGKPGTGGTAATGGNKPGTGGSAATGGNKPGTGGSAATGGKPGTGGTAATGGKPSSGGAKATGGTPGTGGVKATGGTSSKACGSEVEPNDDFAHATTLIGPACGSLTSTTDTDWYKLGVSVGVRMIAMTADKDATFGIGYVVNGSCALSLTGLRQVQVQVVGATASLCLVVSSPGKIMQSYMLSESQ